MEELLTFEQAYNNAIGANPKNMSLLLGNGFSMGYEPRRFSFTDLLQSAIDQGIIQQNSKLHLMFKHLNTSDFEKVIKALEDGLIVSETYFHGLSTDEISGDIEALKKHLVDTIMNNHPDSSNEIINDKSSKCSNFFGLFKKIYTLNYDLLSYWVILKNGMENTFTDGFGESEEEDQEYVVYKEHGITKGLLFLHGGLHIFDNKTEIKKLTFCRTDKTLKSQIIENLSQDIYPVFVSEGTSATKLEKIKHNPYLNSCYKSLESTTGDLFILGTALKSNDEHIRKAIINGGFSNLYIGVWSESDLILANDLKEEFEAKSTDKKAKRAFLYNAKTINPWG